MRRVSVAVIGLGRMGTHHARVLADLEGARLSGVADASREARARYRAPAGVEVYEDHRSLFDRERPDAVVIAVPPALHREVACAAMERGAHVLVEKPIALRRDDALAIVAAASARGVKLMVGHVERFNPAVVELKRRLGAGELGRVWKLHARRLLPLPARVADVGVALDLALHDIDAMLHLTEGRIVRAYGETSRAPHATCEDALSGLLRFSTGEIGVLDVSRRSPKKLRELSVLGEGGALVVDYLAQDLRWIRSERTDETWERTTHFPPSAETLETAKTEPLRAELAAFVRAIALDEAPPVTGEDGVAAVQVALDLVLSGIEGRPIER